MSLFTTVQTSLICGSINLWRHAGVICD